MEYPNIPRMPLKELKAFKRVSLDINQQKTIQFSIALSELKKWNLDKSDWQLYKGDYIINVGSNSEDKKLTSTFHLN